ncbi:MAG: plasmid pRiA4b ORF-3 family protein [Nodularia sp. CChRGM 3473]
MVLREVRAEFRLLAAPVDPYDFGDSWEHEILVEKGLPSTLDINYPICITGKRACPPEDCGGSWGYAELLEIITSPSHPE